MYPRHSGSPAPTGIRSSLHVLGLGNGRRGRFFILFIRGKNAHLQTGNIIIRVSLAALIHDVGGDNTVIHRQLTSVSFAKQAVDRVLNGEIRPIVIAAEIVPGGDIGNGLVGHQVRQAAGLGGSIFIEVGAKPFPLPLIKAHGGIEVKQLMGKEVDFLADVQKGPAREGADIEFIPLAGGLLPLDKLHLLLDDLDGGIQLVALTAQLLRLLGEHLQVITQAVAAEKGLDLGKRVVQPPQVPDRGQRIDLVEVVKAAVILAVAHLRHQQTLGVIMAQQLDIHVENVGKLPDGQKFFYKKPPIFPV